MQRRFAVASSPHLRDDDSTQRIMRDVCIALAPAGLAGIWFFGLNAAALILVSVFSAVAAEWLYQRHAKKPVTVGDWSAVVTGLLLAYNLPAGAPLWLAAVGSIFAIVVAKQFFGGIGQNFINPALVARAVLIASWTGPMATWVAPQSGWLLAGWNGTADVLTSATPLAVQAGQSGYTLMNLFLGNVPGCLGETSKLALLLGAAYLLWRRVINWRIPVCFLGTVALLFFAQTGTLYSFEAGTQSVLYQLLSGGLILGALFMATDYSSSPVTHWGQIIYGLGCGLVLFCLRAFNDSFSEACMYAILIMNCVAPLIDRATRPRVFGEVKGNA